MLVQTRHVVWRGRHSSRHTFFLIALGHFFSGYWKAAVSQGAQNSKWDLPLNRVCGCRHWGAGITRLSEIPNFYGKLSQSPGSFLSILASDGLLFGKWRWRLDVWTQSQYPFPRAQGVICVLEPQSSPQDLQRNKSNAFLISLENHPKGTEGAKGWCWCAVTLPENFTEGRMRSRRKLRGEATADQIFAQDTHRLALDHGGA